MNVNDRDVDRMPRSDGTLQNESGETGVMTPYKTLHVHLAQKLVYTRFLNDVLEILTRKMVRPSAEMASTIRRKWTSPVSRAGFSMYPRSTAVSILTKNFHHLPSFQAVLLKQLTSI